jgi:two-component sensor histidine kinase
MLRLSELDVPERLSAVLPRWASEILTALVVSIVAGLVRLAADTVFPGLAPFALLFPAGLVAALLAGWRAGALSFFGGELYAWYFIYPPAGFAVQTASQAGNLVVIALSGALMLFVAQTFRDSAKLAAAERAAKLEERDLLLSELNHRMKNNFQMVASLLELQRGRAKGEAEKEALGQALNRVMGIAQAHRNLYVSGEDVSSIDVGAYLTDLCGHLADALFMGRMVRLDCKAEPASMERDRAVALGLIVNELVTNAAKHAFEEGVGGVISVTFAPTATGWRLSVEDDGKGLPADFAKSKRGLGRGLIDGFARQARGVLTIEQSAGAAFVLDMER